MSAASARSEWVSIGRGWITAAGAPSRARLARWAAAGVTDVVTLQRAGEYPVWLPAACASAGLHWHHRPLSGGRLSGPGDGAMLARMAELVPLLLEPPPRRVVVHCSAGLHRTGAALYALLRFAGFTADAAVHSLADMRPLTAEELCRPRRTGSVRERADRLLQGEVGRARLA